MSNVLILTSDLARVELDALKEELVHSDVRLFDKDFALKLQEYWRWLTAVIVLDLGIAKQLRMFNSKWPYGTYYPHSAGWARSQLGSKHYHSNGHSKMAFVHPIYWGDNEETYLVYEWQSFVNCYC